jgi:hypothetical protein
VEQRRPTIFDDDHRTASLKKRGRFDGRDPTKAR